MNNPKKTAFEDMKDMIESLRKIHNVDSYTGWKNSYDNYIVGSYHIDTKKQRYLNKLLGIHSINKGVHNKKR